jgi:hypothetical protein
LREAMRASSACMRSMKRLLASMAAVSCQWEGRGQAAERWAQALKPLVGSESVGAERR